MRAIGFVMATVTGIAGCAAPQTPVPIEQARALMLGRPAAQIAACMGNPPVQRSRGTTTLWSYPSSTATRSAPPTLSDPAAATFQYTPLDGDPIGQGLGVGPLGVSEGPAAPSGCIVNVTLDAGVVRAVTYVGPNGALLRQDRECSAIVRGCLR